MLDTVLGAQKQTVNKMETNPSVMGSILEETDNKVKPKLLLLLFCRYVLSNTMYSNLPGFSVYGIPRQEYWSGLPFCSPGGTSWPRDQTHVSCLAGRFFTTELPEKPPPTTTPNKTYMCILGDGKWSEGKDKGMAYRALGVEFMSSVAREDRAK